MGDYPVTGPGEETSDGVLSYVPRDAPPSFDKTPAQKSQYGRVAGLLLQGPGSAQPGAWPEPRGVSGLGLITFPHILVPQPTCYPAPSLA